MSTSSHSAIDRDGVSGGGFGQSSDEWSTLFEKSVESASLKVEQLAYSPPNQTHFEMKGKAAVKPLHLDLNNFEEPAALESRYVLTSPRSLEACARFGIKPVELLHKSYEEFLDEYKTLYDTNYSHDAIFEVFQEHERQRKRKLRLCQEERQRIITEKERRERDVIGDFTKKTRRSPTKHLQETNHAKQNTFTRTNSSTFTRTNSSPTLHKDNISKEKHHKSFSNTSSPERKLSADGYHETSTKGKIGKSQSFTSHVTRTRGETSDSDTGERTSSPHVRRVRSQWSIPKTGSLPCSPRTTRRDSECSTNSLTRQTSQPKKPNRAMSTECILNAVGGKRVSDKDQKIIDLMLSRHEEAQQLRQDKLMLDLAWDDQRRLENDLRQSRMKQRHADLCEQYSAKDLKQMEVRARKERKELKLKQEKEEAIRAKQLLWEQEKQKQQQSLANKIELKRLADAEKKRQQEEKRRQKEREDEMNRNIAYLSLLDKHEKAVRNRSRKITHEQFKLQIQNESEKAKIVEKREEVEKRKQEDKFNLKNQITEKHRRAIENYEDVLIRRENEMRDSKRKKREKVIRQREQLNRMEAELSDWKKNLKTYQEESLKRAEAISAMNITKKQLKARSHLVAKKVVHAENFERVKEDDERRREEIQHSIGLKDERSDLVNMEKEEAMKMSREAAVSSQAVRSIVKEKTYKRCDDDDDGTDDGHDDNNSDDDDCSGSTEDPTNCV